MSRRRTAPLGFAQIRKEFELPESYPEAAVAAAVAATDRFPEQRRDARDIPLVTIDPPGSMDLDQAVHLVQHDKGFTVHYAIADVAALIVPGNAVDQESWLRGETVYLPDGNVPLHPREFSEGSASLLPEQDRLAVLWSIETDAEGKVRDFTVERAIVRSREQLTYAQVQASFDSGKGINPSIAALPRFGELRRGLAQERGAIELQLPDQEVVPEGKGYTLRLEPRTVTDGDNAQISLLTGMCAAELMIQAKIGLLRTLPEASDEAKTELRGTAKALGFPITEQESIAEILNTYGNSGGQGFALMSEATSLLRGSGYTFFDGELPENTYHAGVAANYAHVTAPLRRLPDRYATEVCLAIAAGAEIPTWVQEALPEVPEVMKQSGRRSSSVERACVDQIEASLMAQRIGEEFPATVLRQLTGKGSNTGKGPDAGKGVDSEIYIAEPPIIASTKTDAVPGTELTVTVVAADPEKRSTTFRVTGSGKHVPDNAAKNAARKE